MARSNIICVRCPKGCRIKIEAEDKQITNITGFSCPRGKEYALGEFKNPTRILPTTVKVENGELPLVPVKTEKAIPRKLLLPAMQEIAKTTVEAPVKLGQIIIKNIMDTDVNVVATRDIKEIS